MSSPTPKFNRKYRCFVCGQDFYDYEDFKEHILETHEAKKEYVVCDYCGAPVRDLRLHYSVMHPWEKSPQAAQMRATVWYDFSGRKPERKKKAAFKEGYFTSPKNGFKQMHYRSGYELEVYELLENINEVIQYEVEPEDCCTSYYWQGEQRRYWPDLKVHFADGHKEVWEIKPKSQEDDPINLAKWEACATAMSRRDIVFSVKTEKFIKQLRKKVKGS